MLFSLALQEKLMNVSTLNINNGSYLEKMRWSSHEARMCEDRGVHRVLVGKSEGMRPL